MKPHLDRYDHIVLDCDDPCRILAEACRRRDAVIRDAMKLLHPTGIEEAREVFVLEKRIDALNIEEQ